MECPKCSKNNYCGCKSCKKRKKLNSLRSNTMKGDFITCGYCRTRIHFDAWLEADAKFYLPLGDTIIQTKLQ